MNPRIIDLIATVQRLGNAAQAGDEEAVQTHAVEAAEDIAYFYANDDATSTDQEVQAINHAQMVMLQLCAGIKNGETLVDAVKVLVGAAQIAPLASE